MLLFHIAPVTVPSSAKEIYNPAVAAPVKTTSGEHWQNWQGLSGLGSVRQLLSEPEMHMVRCSESAELCQNRMLLCMPNLWVSDNPHPREGDSPETLPPRSSCKMPLPSLGWWPMPEPLLTSNGQMGGRKGGTLGF